MQWFSGFVSGVLATLIGFGLTVAWDIRKDRREKAEKDEAITRAVDTDLESNRRIIEQNLKTINDELQILSEQQHIVKPLSLLKTGFWEVARINPPTKLITTGKLAKLADLAARTDALNDEIRSKETYRMHNEAMDNFSHRLRIYDDELVRQSSELRDMLSAYQR